MRKVHVKVTLDVFLRADDDVGISEVIGDMDYDLTDTTGKATVENVEYIDHEVTDSR